jgi:phosphatidate cytidylyltransferase
MFLLSSLDYITAADSSHVVLCMRLGTFGFLAVILSAALIVYGGQGRIGTCGEVAQVGFPAISQIGIGGAALVALAGSPNSTRLLMLLLFTVCINDIAAYFGGRKFGGPKLAAVISPGKTISGALSGLVGGVVSGAILLQVMSPNGVSVLSIVILGSVVISAQLGDLNKSYLKRVYGVKDSSAILPGHGGIFDRIDGLLMGAPLLCFMASLLLPQ